ncbi:MAG TPA: glycoside hydrolase family 95 protein [Rhodanobacteraceae bacterium]
MRSPFGTLSRRDFLRGAASLAAGLPLLNALPVLAAASSHDAKGTAQPPPRLILWSQRPAQAANLLFEGYPVGNGRLGALVGGGPQRDTLSLGLGSLWTGGANDTLLPNGQFPYDHGDFGSFNLLARPMLALPAHAPDAVGNYRRELDLADGCVRVTHSLDGVTYRREVFASHPDRVLVMHLSQSGGGAYTGTFELHGAHGETPADAPDGGIEFTGKFANGLHYAVVAMAAARHGTLRHERGVLTFSGCDDLTLVIAAATNYVPAPEIGFIAAMATPVGAARAMAAAAIARAPHALLAAHVADHRALFDRMRVDLGVSPPAQRQLDTASRLQQRQRTGAADPELDALFLQYGRYLTIAGSRDGLPTNLQGLWLIGNRPPWHGDYHTDINLEMNYWLPDRAGLGACFAPLADYCLAQHAAWTRRTLRWFNDPRNPFRNTSGKIAGWTVAISENIFGGDGWRWHPAGNAWLCNNLWHHYQYTLDRTYLARVFPLLKGACEFWQARLIETTVTNPDTGTPQRVLIDDHDWSPEQGPTDARGITYAQELVWDLFGNFIAACAVLQRDAAYAEVIDGLRKRLYLPRVSPKTGWLEEWMTPDDLGSPTHRHLSPLIGLFPGDRIVPGQSPPALIDGARRLLEARGMHSYGWANAWRALCWARLKDGEKAYQLLLNNLTPSDGRGNGTAANLFDVYDLDGRGVFQIDSNFGTPAAIIEMLLYSRPGYIEVLPALPGAWPRGHVSGIGARGGFVVDLVWEHARPVEVMLHSVGGTHTRLAFGSTATDVRVRPGESVRLTLAGGGWRQHRVANGA